MGRLLVLFVAESADLKPAILPLDRVEQVEVDFDAVLSGAVQASEHDAENYRYRRQAPASQCVSCGAVGEPGPLGPP